MSGPQVWPAEMAQYQPADTPERLERLLARYATLPGDDRAVHRHPRRRASPTGGPSAITPVRRAIEQIERLLAMTPAEHPASSMAQVADDERERRRWRRSRSTSTRPCVACATTWRDELRAARPPAAGAVGTTPGGDDAYRLAIRMQTTLDTTAEEVHAFGLADLESIEAEKDEIARRLGHADRHALARRAGRRPGQPHRRSGRHRAPGPGADRSRLRRGAELLRPPAERELLSSRRSRPTARPSRRRRSTCRRRSTARARASTTSTPTSRRSGSSTRSRRSPSTRRRPAITSRSRSRWSCQGLPAFRTLGARMAGVAYVEGWGLYTERLADEMGLYASTIASGSACSTRSRSAPRASSSTPACTPWAGRASRRSTSCTSAARCRWSTPRSRSTATRSGRARRSRTSSASARSSARARTVSAAMGDRFDLRAFHDEVLGHGSLPLATLTARDRQLGGGGGQRTPAERSALLRPRVVVGVGRLGGRSQLLRDVAQVDPDPPPHLVAPAHRVDEHVLGVANVRRGLGVTCAPAVEAGERIGLVGGLADDEQRLRRATPARRRDRAVGVACRRPRASPAPPSRRGRAARSGRWAAARPGRASVASRAGRAAARRAASRSSAARRRRPAPSASWRATSSRSGSSECASASIPAPTSPSRA